MILQSERPYWWADCDICGVSGPEHDVSDGENGVRALYERAGWFWKPSQHDALTICPECRKTIGMQ